MSGRARPLSIKNIEVPEPHPEIDHPEDADAPCNCQDCRDNLISFGGFLAILDVDSGFYTPKMSADNPTKIVGVSNKDWLATLTDMPILNPETICDKIIAIGIRAFERDYSQCVAVDFNAGKFIKPAKRVRAPKDDPSPPAKRKPANGAVAAADIMPRAGASADGYESDEVAVTGTKVAK